MKDLNKLNQDRMEAASFYYATALTHFHRAAKKTLPMTHAAMMAEGIKERANKDKWSNPEGKENG